jgi:hypothetical protein
MDVSQVDAHFSASKRKRQGTEVARAALIDGFPTSSSAGPKPMLALVNAAEGNPHILAEQRAAKIARMSVQAPERYEIPLAESGDQERLLVSWAISCGVPLRSLTHPLFSQAMQCGLPQFQSLSANSFYRMRDFEARETGRMLEKQLVKISKCSLLIDGRRMKEGRHKEALENSAVAYQG